MEISSENQARYLAQKKKELVDEQTALERDRANVQRQRLDETQRAAAKTNQAVVEISREGERQLEVAKQLHRDRVQGLLDNNHANFERLAESTAAELRNVDEHAKNVIADRRAGTTERILNVNERTEDPFYRTKSLNPTFSENEREFTVRVTLPPHEAENLVIAGEGQALKLTLSRRFQEQTAAPERSTVTRTSSFMTVSEQLRLPGAISAKGISREYADGQVVIHVPRAGHPPLPAAETAPPAPPPPSA